MNKLTGTLCGLAVAALCALPAWAQEVARWGDYYNPALSEQDVDDVTAYLNTRFYRF